MPFIDPDQESPFRWTCAHCGHSQVANEHNFSSRVSDIYGGVSSIGLVAAKIVFVRCLNSDCAKPTLTVFLQRRDDVHPYSYFEVIERIQIIPESRAKPQPEFVPAPVRQDYSEACRILVLSPKAAATLARRCLQGMIRDFCGITKPRLVEEIAALKKLVEAGHAPAGVTPESVDGIDQVRQIGNIGAHMESDINLVVDVDAGEADALVDLIETLFDEWYVARHAREQRFAKLTAIAKKKKEELNAAKTTPPPGK